MFSGYFLPRWQAFFAGINAAFDAGTAFDRKPFAAVMCEWEQKWSSGSDAFQRRPKGDPIAVSRRLAAKYR